MESEQSNRQSEKQNYWQKHLKTWEESGLTQAAYCKENSLVLQTFCYWRRKFKQSPHGRPTFFPLEVMPREPQGNKRPSSSIKLSLRAERFLIEVDHDFSRATLKKLLTVLEEI